MQSTHLCFALWIDFKCNGIAPESIRVCPGQERFPIPREASVPPKPRRNLGKLEKRRRDSSDRGTWTILGLTPMPLPCGQAGYWVPLTTWGLIWHLEKVHVPAQGRVIRETMTLRGEKKRGSDSPKAQQKDISEELSGPIACTVEL